MNNRDHSEQLARDPSFTAYENRLIARFRQGETEALGALFEMHADRVYAYSRHMLRNKEDAEEVTTETFVKAFQHALSYRAEGAFTAWLFRIARNLCLDRMRQPCLTGLEPAYLDDLCDDKSTEQQTETKVVVNQALEMLHEDYRMILMLCDIQQWDAQEAALIMDRSLPATKSLLYRARRALKELLKSSWNEDKLQDEM